MIDGMTPDVLGLGIGFIGVVLATYSIIKQKKLENRIKEKEKLKELAKFIENHIISRIIRIKDVIIDPTKDEDAFSQLQMLSQEVVTKSFDEKKEIINLISEIRMDIEEKHNSANQKEFKKTKTINISTENQKEAIKYLEEGMCRYISIECTSGNNILYSVNDFLLGIRYLFSDLDKLEKEFGDIIDEIKPTVLKDLKECVNEMFLIVLDSAINSNNIEINTKLFNKTDEIGLWIFNSVNGINKLKPLLDNLIELEIRTKKFKDELVYVSY